MLQEFNRGVFDYLIATDASVDRGEEDEDEDGGVPEDDHEVHKDENLEDENDNLLSAKKDGKSAKKRKRVENVQSSGDDGYGVSRGIDFKGVNFVINFDFPTTAAAYTHRIGRTARGNASGTALSFVTKMDPKKVIYS